MWLLVKVAVAGMLAYLSLITASAASWDRGWSRRFGFAFAFVLMLPAIYWFMRLFLWVMNLPLPEAFR